MGAMCFMPSISHLYAHENTVPAIEEPSCKDGQQQDEEIIKKDILIRLSLLGALGVTLGSALCIFDKYDRMCNGKEYYWIEKQDIAYPCLMAICATIGPALLHFSGLAKYPSDARFYNMFFKSK